MLTEWGLYTVVGVFFAFGILTGWATARHLPDRLRRLLGC